MIASGSTYARCTMYIRSSSFTMAVVLFDVANYANIQTVALFSTPCRSSPLPSSATGGKHGQFQHQDIASLRTTTDAKKCQLKKKDKTSGRDALAHLIIGQKQQRPFVTRLCPRIVRMVSVGRQRGVRLDYVDCVADRKRHQRSSSFLFFFSLFSLLFCFFCFFFFAFLLFVILLLQFLACRCKSPACNILKPTQNHIPASSSVDRQNCLDRYACQIINTSFSQQ